MAIKLSRKMAIFDDWRFLLDAVDTEIVFMAIRYVKVEANKAYATDGYRLHIIDDVEFQDGLYEVIKNTKTEIILELAESDLRWPEVGRIIQSTENYKHRDEITFEHRNPGFSLNIFRLLHMLGFPINIDYLKPLRGNTWKVRWGEKALDGPVVFTSGKYKAFIMPIHDGSSEQEPVKDI